MLAARAPVGSGRLVGAEEGHAPSGGAMMGGRLDEIAQGPRVDNVPACLAGHGGPAQQGADRDEQVDLRRERGAPARPAGSRRTKRPRGGAASAVTAGLTGRVSAGDAVAGVAALREF